MTPIVRGSTQPTPWVTMINPAEMAPGINCSYSCTTKDHVSFGECMRSKNLQLNPRLADAGASHKAWDRELNSYKDAYDQGIRPHGTTQDKIDEAVRISNETGVAFQ